jgi:ribosomal-protein-alanine N-acetyltransferase
LEITEKREPMPGAVFIDGETVSLRTIEEEDLEFLQRVVNKPEIRRAIGASGPVNGPQEEEFFEETVSEDGSVDLLVTVDGERVGIAGLIFGEGDVTSAELGYWLAPDHHGQGYGSEAAALLVEYGFEQRACHRIQAHVFGFNDASQALLESVGFTREGTRREAHFTDGEYGDVHIYGLLAEEWRGER